MIESKTHCTCPACGRRIDFNCKRIIEKSDLELVEAVKNYTFFNVKCPYCNEIITPVYDCGYLDRSQNLLISYLINNEQSMDEFEYFLQNVPNRRNWTLRIVNNYESYIEKINIFRNGLDDRAIEIMKFICLTSVRHAHPNVSIKSIYCEPETDRSLVFKMFLDRDNNKNEQHFLQKVVTYDIYKKWYQLLMDEYSKLSEQDCVIDFDWVVEILAKTGKLDEIIQWDDNDN